MPNFYRSLFSREEQTFTGTVVNRATIHDYVAQKHRGRLVLGPSFDYTIQYDGRTTTRHSEKEISPNAEVTVHETRVRFLGFPFRIVYVPDIEE